MLAGLLTVQLPGNVFGRQWMIVRVFGFLLACGNPDRIPGSWFKPYEGLNVMVI